MNAVSTEMARSIAAACAALAADRDVRVVVLTSTHERAFCVGADLKERNSFTDAELVRQRPTARAAYTGRAGAADADVAAVHGFALGGGFELALVLRSDRRRPHGRGGAARGVRRRHPGRRRYAAAARAGSGPRAPPS